MCRSVWLPVALAAALFGVVAETREARADDADSRKRAATEYDAGVTSFKKKDFDGAAAHFEAANLAMPSAGALRQAIRARGESGQGARAATLAVLALDLYPKDTALTKVAHEAVEKFEIVLHKVHVKCSAPCTVSVGQLPVPGDARATWDVYLDPGAGAIVATFGDEAVSKDVDAKAGGESDLRIDPPKKAAAVAPVPTPAADDADGKPKPTASDDDKPKTDDDKKTDDDTKRHGLSPVFFGISAAAFAGFGAATIWSGVDTLNNPGQAAVRAQCAGQGMACPAFQEGLAHQQRTNVLLGVTGGTAALTVLLGVFTDWKGSSKPKADESAPSTDVSPTAIFLDRGGALGVRGAF